MLGFELLSPPPMSLIANGRSTIVIFEGRRIMIKRFGAECASMEIEYYPLIRRAVCALENNTKGERHALYETVRNALAGMLRASDPSPTDSEIVSECLLLETAISQVEAPYSCLESLTHLPPHTRAALRSALDVMRGTDTPLPPSKLAARLKRYRSTTSQSRLPAPPSPERERLVPSLAARTGQDTGT
jgi:hypothetical protein